MGRRPLVKERCWITATKTYGEQIVPGLGSARREYWRVVHNTSPDPATHQGLDVPGDEVASIEDITDALADTGCIVTEPWEYMYTFGGWRARGERQIH